MFFKLTTLAVLLSLLSVVFCAVGIGSPSVHPDHPGKCWHSETEKAYAPGDIFTAPGCARLTCQSDFSLDWATCGVVLAEPPCRVVDGDSSLEYPKCCPDVKCD